MTHDIFYWDSNRRGTMKDKHKTRSVYSMIASITVVMMLLASSVFCLFAQVNPQSSKSESFYELLKQQQAREKSIRQISYQGTVRQYARRTLERLADESVDDYVSRCASVDPIFDAKIPPYPIHGNRDFVSGIYEFSQGEIQNVMPKFMHWFVGKSEIIQLMGRDAGKCEGLITKHRADIQDDLKACLVRLDTNAFRPINDRVMSEVLMKSTSESGIHDIGGRPLWKLEKMKDSGGLKATFMTQQPVDNPPEAKQILWYTIYWQMNAGELVIARIDELPVVGDGDSMPKRVTLLDNYRTVAGKPLPFRIRCFLFGKSLFGAELRVEDAKVNDDVDVPESLAIPEGTRVRNLITGKIDERARTSPQFKACVVCFNGKLDSRSSCSTNCFQPDGTLHPKGKMTCGYVGQASEIEWSFVERRNDKDVYRFTRRFPLDTADVSTTKKTVEFSDRRVVVFEDNVQAIVIEPPKK
ncbi:MAG: hypothetical protein U0941_14550 [Planctomycetaceae bacterium]